MPNVNRTGGQAVSMRISEIKQRFITASSLGFRTLYVMIEAGISSRTAMSVELLTSFLETENPSTWYSLFL